MHGGADLDFMIIKAKDGLDGETNGMLADIQANRLLPPFLTRKNLEERGQTIDLDASCSLSS